MDSKREIHISKFLSLILRHKPETIGITLNPEGWVSVDTLLRACADHGEPLTRQELQQVVDNNSKKRFEIKATEREKIEMIRASQGHSIEVDLGYTEQTPPDVLFHGTAIRFMESIKEKGLLKMDRHHVHLSETEATAWDVGKRHGKPTVFRIDAKKMTQDGFKFFKSTNGVWLTERVPSGYMSPFDDPMLPPHRRIYTATYGPWESGSQQIRVIMANGRDLRFTISGFDKVDAIPVVERLLRALPKIIAGTD